MALNPGQGVTGRPGPGEDQEPSIQDSEIPAAHLYSPSGALEAQGDKHLQIFAFVGTWPRAGLW